MDKSHEPLYQSSEFVLFCIFYNEFPQLLRNKEANNCCKISLKDRYSILTTTQLSYDLCRSLKCRSPPSCF